MTAQAKATNPAAGHGLETGVSFFQVLEPSKILGAGGEAQYAMMGPFADLVAASQFAMTRPGAFVTVTLILHQVPVTPPAAAPVSHLAKR